MYLRGSKWSMNKRRLQFNPWVVIFLVLAIAFFIYLNIQVIPNVPPPFVHTPTPTRNPQEYLAEADAFLAEGRMVAAVDSFKAAIAVQPDNINTFLSLAKLQAYLGDYEGARGNAENALLLDNKSARAYALLGWIKGLQGEYAEGEQNILSALQLDPGSAYIHGVNAHVLAMHYYASGGEANREKATEASNQAMAIDPSILEVRWARGFVLEITGNYNEALAQYTAAAAINDNIAALHAALGRNYFALAIEMQNEERYSEALDNYALAVQSFTRASTLNPADPTPNLSISQIYAREGDYAKAIQYGEVALTADPADPILYMNLGTLYFRQMQYNRAIEYFTFAIKGGVTSEGVTVPAIPLDYSMNAIFLYSRYGLSLANANQCGEAVRIAQQMIQTVADDLTAVYNAEEMITICTGNLATTPTPLPTAEETPQADE